MTNTLTPAPDTAKAETAVRNIPELLPQPPTLEQRMSAVEARMDAIEGQATQITREELGRHAFKQQLAHVTDQTNLMNGAAPTFTTTRTIPLDDVPGETQEPLFELNYPPEPWRPTIGRDAVTRDGRRARNVRAYDGGLAATVTGNVCDFYPAYTLGGEGKDGMPELDLIGDWIEPEQAETPKRKWAKDEECYLGTDQLLEYFNKGDTEIRVKRTTDGFSIKRRVK